MPERSEMEVVAELHAAVDAMHEHMLRELMANRRKGDRAGWLALSPMQLVLEVFHHAAKLHRAVTELDKAESVGSRAFARVLVREFAADVANMAMMTADACGVLGLPEGEPAAEPAPNTAWTRGVVESEA